MRKITILTLLVMGAVSIQAQTLAPTTPLNKNAIVEEFTGVRCPNCPPGHVIVANMQAANPGRVFVVGYHPTNSSYTTPRNSSDPDFRRAYLDAFYQSSYVGSRYMPGAMINRKTYAGERMVSRNSWDSYAQGVMGEASPLNVGLASSYNSSTGMLTVDVEAYFTADVTDQLALFVHIMEDGLIADQSNGSPNYVHKHVFREALTGQWGDDITTTTNQGDLFSTQLTFDESTATDAINMDNAEVIAFIYNSTSGEVVSGYAVKAKGGSSIGLEEETTNMLADAKLYPNPATDDLTFEINNLGSGNVSATILDVVGKQVYTKDFDMSAGKNLNTISLSDIGLKEGVYYLQLSNGKDITTKKFIKS